MTADAKEGAVVTDDELRIVLIHTQGCSNYTGEHDNICGSDSECGCLETVRALREYMSPPTTTHQKLIADMLAALELVRKHLKVPPTKEGEAVYKQLVDAIAQARATEGA